MRRQGDLRISEGAAEELRRIAGEYGSMVAKAAVDYALGEGRKTVLDRDVRAAAESVWGGRGGD